MRYGRWGWIHGSCFPSKPTVGVTAREVGVGGLGGSGWQAASPVAARRETK
jgi:hypothetical protein